MDNINIQRSCEILSETHIFLKQDVLFPGLFNTYYSMYDKIALRTISHNCPHMRISLSVFKIQIKSLIT